MKHQIWHKILSMNCGHDATTTSLHYCSQDLGCKKCHQCKDDSTKMQKSVCAQVQNDEVNAEFSSSFEKQKATDNWCLPVVSWHSYTLLAGMPFTSGLHSRSGVVASVDAPPLTLLKKAGAIPLGTTNTSELCMWLESHNHLHGITKNPYDLERIPGGSSG